MIDSMKKRKLGPTGAELSKKDEEEILGWFESNPKYDFLLAVREENIEIFLPLERRLRIRDKILHAQYVYKGMPLLNRDIGEYKVKKRKQCGNESHHKKFIDKIQSVLALGKSTEEELNYLQDRKERWKKRQRKWDEAFQNFETKDQEWVNEWNEKLSSPETDEGPDIIVSEPDIIKKYRKIVKDSLCKQMYGEWTVSQVLTFIINEIAIRKKLIGKHPKQRLIKEVDTILKSSQEIPSIPPKQISTNQFPFIELVLDNNRDYFIEVLWEELKVDFIPKTSLVVFRSHFLKDQESEELIIWRGTQVLLLYLFYQLWKKKLFYQDNEDADIADYIIDHFEIYRKKKKDKEPKDRRGSLRSQYCQLVKKLEDKYDPDKIKNSIEIDNILSEVLQKYFQSTNN